jgi:uroporphyrinogen decarboxylase
VETVDNLFLRTLSGTTQSHTGGPPPVWLMRQAGRYLPEYRELRTRARDFLDFCYTPSLATEATLQPIRRYGFDAAILFADILLLPDALGRGVRFEAGEGPRMTPLEDAGEIDKVSDSRVLDHVSPVFETVSRVRKALPAQTALIGFAGSPWTVATYIIEGRGGTDKLAPRTWAHARPADLARVLDRLADVTVLYLEEQVKAGADTLMLFDSWADNLPSDIFDAVVTRPTRRIVDKLRARGVTVPIIGFARGAGSNLLSYQAGSGAGVMGLDTAVDPDWVHGALPAGVAVQGNLDPILLKVGGSALHKRVASLMDAFKDRPYVFNLGHGITPDVPPEHVSFLLKAIRGT